MTRIVKKADKRRKEIIQAARKLFDAVVEDLVNEEFKQKEELIKSSRYRNLDTLQKIDFS